MRNLLRFLILSAMAGLSLTMAQSVARADEDEYWGGYWKWYDNTYRPYYGRPHSLRYGPSQPTLYYGHAPPAADESIPSNRESVPLYNRAPPTNYKAAPPAPAYRPYYGPGRYYGPSIFPYYAPGRNYYGSMKYGWW